MYIKHTQTMQLVHHYTAYITCMLQKHIEVQHYMYVTHTQRTTLHESNCTQRTTFHVCNFTQRKT